MILTFSRFLIQNLSMQIFSKSYGHFSFIKIGFTLLLKNNISFVWYHLTEDHDLLSYTFNKENHLGQKVTQGKWLTIIRIFIYLLSFRHWALAQMTPPSLVRTRWRVVSEVMGSRSTRCMFNLPIKKKKNLDFFF